jgi:NitT/TauT family transport system substrate-binding protein
MFLPRKDFVKLAGVASLAGLAGATANAQAQDLRTVRMLSVPSDGSKALLYAQQAGLFRKHGIQADILPMGSGAAIFAALLGGSADFGAGSLLPVFTAYAHGVPLRIIAPISLYESAQPDSVLLVQKDSPIRSARDLNGKSMGGNTPSDIFVAATRAWVDQHGGDGKSLRAIELQPSEQLAALEAGRIDATVLKAPFSTVGLESGKVRVLGKPLDAIAPRFLLSAWVATVDFIAKNPDVVNGFVAACTESARYTNAHPADTIAMVATFSGQDPALLSHGVRSITAESITLADVQRPLDFAYKYGIIDKEFDASAVLAASVPISRGR